MPIPIQVEGEQMDIRPLASDAASEFSIADPIFRRGILAIRWGLLFAYVVLARAGVLDISTTALILSASLIFAYDVFHIGIEVFRDGQQPPLLLVITRLLDVAMVTVALVAIHDVRNPVWAVYFIGIVAVAHMISKQEMLWHMLWVTLNYLAFAFITAALGHSVSWSYVTVVAILIGFMGFNASILAGGEQRLRELITSVAITDSLTGLPNRRQFHTAYPQSIEQAIAKNVPLALMLIDFDHFKDINDREGHPAGDDKLREVARNLQAVIRHGDLVARYGGDEFIVVAPHATRDDALVLAERLRAAAVECSASVSIGLAIFPEDAGDQDKLIQAADGALYRAKAAGRNCVRDAVAA